MKKIKNKNFEITIKKHGAELTSVLGYNHEYLWTGDPKFWNRHAPVLFPIVGAVKDGEYTVDGKEYKLSQHGFARDLDFKLIDESFDSVTYAITYSDDTLKVYPFKFSLEIEYVLTDNELQITYNVKNLDDKTIYYSVGAHPGFNIENINDYTLSIDGEYNIYDLDAGYIGEKTLNQKGDVICSKEFFEPGAFIYEPKGEKVLTLNYKDNPYISMEYKDFELMGVWTPEGKEAPFLCLEPWNGIADFNSRDNKEFIKKDFIQSLDQGQSKASTYTIKFFKKEK